MNAFRFIGRNLISFLSGGGISIAYDCNGNGSIIIGDL